MSNPFFTGTRFEPDSILIYAILVVLALALYFTGFGYIAIMPSVTVAIIFGVESLETIRLEKPGRKQLLGARCKVLRQISKTERGVVQILGSAGNREWELWSAESGYLLQEGEAARVCGATGIILQVEPLGKEESY